MTQPDDRRQPGPAMSPEIAAITLAVDDLERSLSFYESLGLPPAVGLGQEHADDERAASPTAAMFQLRQGLALVLWARAELASDAGVVPARGRGEYILGHFVDSRAAVDGFLARAEAAGAAITDAPRDRPWGIYSGFFCSPDGHLWEIIARHDT